jgi:SAM-dependent methyltransferase
MDDLRHTALLHDVAQYYSEKLSAHGQTPRGVDWNGADGQQLRFEQLTRMFSQHPGPYSINDIGCGYGALVDFLHARYPLFDYCGTDISLEMIEAARSRYGDRPNTRFVQASRPPASADFSIASGIFNLRQGRTDEDWLEYMHMTLDMMNATTKRAFSFNCLTTYSDAEKMRPDLLYYADPCALFDHCKRHYSRNVALLHDYGLYEFTIIVRKEV